MTPWGVGSFSRLKCRAFFDGAGHDALQLWHDDASNAWEPLEDVLQDASVVPPQRLG